MLLLNRAGLLGTPTAVAKPDLPKMRAPCEGAVYYACRLPSPARKTTLGA